MKIQEKRIIALLLIVVTIFSNIFFPVVAEEVMNEVTNKTTLYRYREKVKWTTRYPLESPWTLISQTSSMQLYAEYNKLDPKELSQMEDNYSENHYYLKKVSDGSCVKYTTNPHGTGTAYYFDEALPDYGMYGNDFTYSEHPTLGIKIYYSDVCTTYTLSVYTRYEYHYWKWSEWSAWSETPVEATEDIEVETKTVALFTVAYDANGGSGAPGANTKEFDKAISISTIVPTKENHQFLGWATMPDGDVEYTPGDEYSQNADLTLYAVWKNVTQYVVDYDANGGTGAPSQQNKLHDEAITLSTKVPVRAGHAFQGWATSIDGEVEYGVGAVFEKNENVTLYAVWSLNEFVVSYNTNGGSGAPENQIKIYGKDLLLSTTTPTKDGYTFLGWSSVKDGTVEYMPNGIYRSDASVMLYAVWQKKAEVIASGVCGDNLTWRLFEDGVFQVSGTGPMYDWWSWQNREMPWYSYKSKITSVKIEEGTTVIGWYTFADCTNLETVILPSSLTTINGYAFSKCTSIKELVVPNNVVIIDSYAFSQCTKIKSLVLGDNLKSIGWQAFYCCSSITSIRFGSNLEAIDSYAFGGCDVVEYIDIPDKVRSIAPEAFASCDSLKCINVHSDNPYYRSDAHGALYDTVNNVLLQYPLNNRNESYVVDNSTVEIARNAFSGCKYLQEVYLPKSLLLIRELNFDNLYGTEKPSTIYYAGSSEEWYRNVTIEGRNGYTSNVIFNQSFTIYTNPVLGLRYPSLSFEDEIFYNVYFTVDDMSGVVEMGLITFNERLTDGTMADAVDAISGHVSGSGMYMVRTNGIPAKKLGDALYFKVYAKLADGSYVYSEVAGYHAVAYANTVLNDAGSSAKAKSLVVAMLNYGAAAQEYFGYKTDSLMNANLTAEQQAMVSAYDESMIQTVMKADSSKVGSFVMNGGYSNIYPTVSFEGAFSINFYFAPNKTVDSAPAMYYWDAKTYASVDVLTAENATGVMTMVNDGKGNWGAAVEGIAAKDMDSTIYVAGIYTSNGTSYPTGVITYSLGKYCQDVYAQGTPFGAATAVYGFYAKAYFA